ncbi:hypothetical protein CEUSTIGMA_g3764.t1 [Chlamydomonas eustigma]|uniref:Telomerase reverse transcriptase n=1 Tax=Chlamydomonas eustigma TaxID=1157962 RepID=A0A250WZQ5_9CHLO|nr:hypothetical protein CEUSTIGMA_g3764.t1 [Chlamydomonas eustigma]|eukprot:GAX76318.1 hypothetical protein CEUSTIGMA_g3764.t1 [Chlamydomonas eustigma]
MQKRPNATSGSRFISGLRYAEPFRQNTVNELLCTQAWKDLLSIIGDSLMLYLLQYTAIFVPLQGGNHNYVQAAGRPISETLKLKPVKLPDRLGKLWFKSAAEGGQKIYQNPAKIPNLTLHTSDALNVQQPQSGNACNSRKERLGAERRAGSCNSRRLENSSTSSLCMAPVAEAPKPKADPKPRSDPKPKGDPKPMADPKPKAIAGKYKGKAPQLAHKGSAVIVAMLTTEATEVLPGESAPHGAAACMSVHPGLPPAASRIQTAPPPARRTARPPSWQRIKTAREREAASAAATAAAVLSDKDSPDPVRLTQESGEPWDEPGTQVGTRASFSLRLGWSPQPTQKADLMCSIVLCRSPLGAWDFDSYLASQTGSQVIPQPPQPPLPTLDHLDLYLTDRPGVEPPSVSTRGVELLYTSVREVSSNPTLYDTTSILIPHLQPRKICVLHHHGGDIEFKGTESLLRRGREHDDSAATPLQQQPCGDGGRHTANVRQGCPLIVQPELDSTTTNRIAAGPSTKSCGVRPSQVIIPRSTMFYSCNRRRITTGLPMNSSLTQAHGKKSAAKFLYSHIFGGDFLTSGLGLNLSSKEQGNTAKPRPLCPRNMQTKPQPQPLAVQQTSIQADLNTWRLKRNKRLVLPILRQMISRAKKCPMGTLLAHHCPLPSAPQSSAHLNNLTADITTTTSLGHPRPPPDSAITQPAECRPMNPGMYVSVAASFVADGVAEAKNESLHRKLGEEDLVMLTQPMSRSQQDFNLGRSQLLGKGGSHVVPTTDRHWECLHGNKRLCTSLPLGTRSPQEPNCGLGASALGITRPTPPLKEVDKALSGSADGSPNDQHLVGAHGLVHHGGEQCSCCGVTGSPEDIIMSACSPQQHVTSFLFAVCRKVLPAGLMGSKNNWKQLRRIICLFVGLRRHEQLSLPQVVHGLRSTDMTWLGHDENIPRSLHVANAKKLLQFMSWLFKDVIIPVIRSTFYVTETEPYKQQVFYFRQPVWAKLQKKALQELITERFISLSNKATLACLQKRNLGTAMVRLLPKLQGMRPIVNLGKHSVARLSVRNRMSRPILVEGLGQAPEVAPHKDMSLKRPNRKQAFSLSFKPVNTVLQGPYHALKSEVSRQPPLLEASVFGYDDVYLKLRPFVAKWRSIKRERADSRLYIVSVDISRAFDSIDIQRLLSIVEPAIKSPSYSMIKYCEVTPALGPTRTRTRHQRAAVVPEQGIGGCSATPRFPVWINSVAGVSRSTVYVDQACPMDLTQEEVLFTLREHLTKNIVKIGSRWYCQSRGIPQGSITSTLLCSLYFADLEAKYLRPVLPNYKTGVDAETLLQQAAAVEGAISSNGTAGSSGPAHLTALAMLLSGVTTTQNTVHTTPSEPPHSGNRDTPNMPQLDSGIMEPSSLHPGMLSQPCSTPKTNLNTLSSMPPTSTVQEMMYGCHSVAHCDANGTPDNNVVSSPMGSHCGIIPHNRMDDVQALHSQQEAEGGSGLLPAASGQSMRGRDLRHVSLLSAGSGQDSMKWHSSRGVRGGSEGQRSRCSDEDVWMRAGGVGRGVVEGSDTRWKLTRHLRHCQQEQEQKALTILALGALQSQPLAFEFGDLIQPSQTPVVTQRPAFGCMFMDSTQGACCDVELSLTVRDSQDVGRDAALTLPADQSAEKDSIANSLQDGTSSWPFEMCDIVEKRKHIEEQEIIEKRGTSPSFYGSTLPMGSTLPKGSTHPMGQAPLVASSVGSIPNNELLALLAGPVEPGVCQQALEDAAKGEGYVMQPRLVQHEGTMPLTQSVFVDPITFPLPTQALDADPVTFPLPTQALDAEGSFMQYSAYRVTNSIMQPTQLLQVGLEDGAVQKMDMELAQPSPRVSMLQFEGDQEEDRELMHPTQQLPDVPMPGPCEVQDESCQCSSPLVSTQPIDEVDMSQQPYMATTDTQEIVAAEGVTARDVCLMSILHEDNPAQSTPLLLESVENPGSLHSHRPFLTPYGSGGRGMLIAPEDVQQVEVLHHVGLQPPAAGNMEVLQQQGIRSAHALGAGTESGVPPSNQRKIMLGSGGQVVDKEAKRCLASLWSGRGVGVVHEMRKGKSMGADSSRRILMSTNNATALRIGRSLASEPGVDQATRQGASEAGVDQAAMQRVPSLLLPHPSSLSLPPCQHSSAESVMMRLVDDFLFVTTSRAAAEVVVSRVHTGFPEYGCSINPLKTKLNFDMELERPLADCASDGQLNGQLNGNRNPRDTGRILHLKSNTWQDGHGSHFIRWCGLLLNAETLEVQADYTRYCNTHVSTSLCVPLSHKPGQQLVLKLAQYMRPKCHALLLDNGINGSLVVRLNIFQAFVLSAMKLHCYLQSLKLLNPPSNRGATRKASKSHEARHILVAVQSAISYLHSLVKARTQAASQRGTLECRCAVSLAEIRWLGLVAFYRVLRRKQSAYQEVLSELKTQLGMPCYCKRAFLERLWPAVSADRNTVFETMKY